MDDETKAREDAKRKFLKDRYPLYEHYALYMLRMMKKKSGFNEIQLAPILAFALAAIAVSNNIKRETITDSVDGLLDFFYEENAASLVRGMLEKINGRSS